MTLMLFDEVDVLPDKDPGFLAALRTIVRESKLNLTELAFEPPSETELLRTVAMVCAASSRPAPGCQLQYGGSGRCPQRLQYLQHLIRSCRGDLRRSLVAAQFWGGGGAEGGEADGEGVRLEGHGLGPGGGSCFGQEEAECFRAVQADRERQWAVYEAQCREIRVHHLAKRWIELDEARAATKLAAKRSRAAGSRHPSAEGPDWQLGLQAWDVPDDGDAEMSQDKEGASAGQADDAERVTAAATDAHSAGPEQERQDGVAGPQPAPEAAMPELSGYECAASHATAGDGEALPLPPPPLTFKADALAALRAPTGEHHNVVDSTLAACRAQAALAELYAMLSDVDILGMPRDTHPAVSGACPVRHQAAHACVRHLALGTNLALLPPAHVYAAYGACAMDGAVGSSSCSAGWVLADAVHEEEEVQGRLCSLQAAELETAGHGSGEPAGPLGLHCAAEAARSLASLAAGLGAEGAATARVPCELQPVGARKQAQPHLLQLLALRSALQEAAPGCATGGIEGALDRLAAMGCICRDEGKRQRDMARSAKHMRRAPVFQHHLAASFQGGALDGGRLAALHQLASMGRSSSAGAQG
ncbi:hypothetical protein GPECTOR_6g593 [Gonium pectorale]|uniref:Uncharacterized protein n=1 Tax=Gonium pectorale TaxID=33097 RepID=A0A150GUX4_GONPE|nr:hypothetical protein GPECTOR_6g593 [Gonium pectorale]|eukprot:KXZ53676.1 hypothetical protein GPECTOR_6g593 [Gonium pectorale]